MCGVVSLAASNVDAEPLGAFFTLPSGTGAHLVDGDSETSDLRALGRITKLGVTAKISQYGHSQHVLCPFISNGHPLIGHGTRSNHHSCRSTKPLELAGFRSGLLTLLEPPSDRPRSQAVCP